MCGRFLLVTLGRDLAERFELAEEPSVEPRYNIAPTQMVAAIRVDVDKRQRRLTMLKWGLIPFWAKDMTIGSRMINARAETVADKPAFRAAFKHRRCLVPADGFYEWKREKGKKQPYLIRMADLSPFAFAGLWEQWKDPEGNMVESCTILTTDANPLIEPIHDRMPVILPPPDYDLWLNPGVKKRDALEPLLRAYPREEMTMSPANPKVNSSTYDAPECMEPPPTV